MILFFFMGYYSWNEKKNERLKADRGMGFEQIVLHIARGDVLAIVDHPNKGKYSGQKILVVDVANYAYLVPFIENPEGKFLKTIIPSRKATRDYLGGKL